MISVTAGIKMIIVSFDPSKELDVVGYVVHASQTSGFVPSASNLINTGTETSVAKHVASGGMWYLRVAAYDTFEDTDSINFNNLRYSAEYGVSVPTLDPLDTTPPDVPTGLDLTTDVDASGQADMSSIKATWYPNGEEDFGGCLLQIRKEADVDFVEAQVASGTTSYVFSGLIPDTEYSVRIAAYDKWANHSEFGSWVSIVSATSTAIPLAPSMVELSAGIENISIIVSSFRAANWKEFEIEASPTGAFSDITYSSTSASTFNSANVTEGTYYVRVRSVSRSGMVSPWTESTPSYVVVEPAAAQIITELQGKLTESELYQALVDRLNLIDAPGTGLVQQVVTVNNNVTALQTTVNSLTVAPFDVNLSYGVGELVTYEANTYRCILSTTAPSPIPTNTTYWALSSDSSNLSALISQETELRIGEDEALAAAILGTQSTLNGQTTAIAMQLESINGLKGQWTVKIDNGTGRVIGVGLSSGDPNTADSEFIVLADKFQVVIPSVNGGVPVIPFQVGTVGGQQKVVIPKAMIGDASIDTARIETLDIGSAKVTGTLNAARIGANTISAAKFEIGTVSLFNESFAGTDPLSNWTNVSGSGELSILSGTSGVVGGKYLHVGNNTGNDQAWLIGKQNIPFDPSRLYKIRVRVRRTAGTGTFYAGWAGIAADGTTYVNVSGTDNSPHFHVAMAASVPNTWTEYEGYTKGFGTAAGTPGVGTLLVPGQMHPNVRYIRPTIIVNYSGVAGITEVDSFIVEEVPVVLAPEYFSNGTFSKTLTVGDSKVQLDGVNKRIVVKDSSNVERVILGNLGSSFGLDIKNALGQSLLTTSGDLEGTRVKNLTVTGNQVVGGNLTISGTSTINGSLASSVAVGGVAAANWVKPGYTLIDGNKIYTGDAYVDTLQIKGNAVTVPVSSYNTYWNNNQDLNASASFTALEAVVNATPVTIFVNLKEIICGVWSSTTTLDRTLQTKVALEKEENGVVTELYRILSGSYARNNTDTYSYYWNKESPFIKMIKYTPALGVTVKYRVTCYYIANGWPGTVHFYASIDDASLLILGCKR